MKANVAEPWLRHLCAAVAAVGVGIGEFRGSLGRAPAVAARLCRHLARLQALPSALWSHSVSGVCVCVCVCVCVSVCVRACVRMCVWVSDTLPLPLVPLGDLIFYIITL